LLRALHIKLHFSALLSEASTLALLDSIWDASCTRAEDRRPGWSLTNYRRFDPLYYRWLLLEEAI
jgi:hypothetical protein